MQTPAGPHIKTTYRPDGTMQQEPVGFGGKMCEKATEPYKVRHGLPTELTHTAEASEPDLLERESGGPERVLA